jgi:hypothetical protein
MKTENWITIASALIVAIGWFVTGYQNRRKDVAQKRLEYRLKALEAFLPVWFTIQKNTAPFSQPGFLALLEDSRSKFQLYGRKDEIEPMEKFVHSIESRDLAGANAALEELVPKVLKRIRKELEIRD